MTTRKFAEVKFEKLWRQRRERREERGAVSQRMGQQALSSTQLVFAPPEERGPSGAKCKVSPSY